MEFNLLVQRKEKCRPRWQMIVQSPVGIRIKLLNAGAATVLTAQSWSRLR